MFEVSRRNTDIITNIELEGKGNFLLCYSKPHYMFQQDARRYFFYYWAPEDEILEKILDKTFYNRDWRAVFPHTSLDPKEKASGLKL